MHQSDYAGHYHKLYQLQDTALSTVSSFDNLFYLTGGTALTRFHAYNHRYSDDLDFFTNGNTLFKSEFKEFLSISESKGDKITVSVESKDLATAIKRDSYGQL